MAADHSGSFPASTFVKVIKEETIEETKKISKKKLELSRELEDLANIGAHFRDINYQNSKDQELDLLIQNHESSLLEFKSTFSQALDNKVDNIIIEHKALQSVVGFLNNKNGGTLIIGIDDKMNVIGIEKDKFRENYDKFRRNFVQKVESFI